MPPPSHGIYFEDAQFEFFLQTLSGKVVPIEARDETTTAEIAAGICEKLGIAESLQRIIFRGTVIYDGFERGRGRDCPIWTMEEVSRNCSSSFLNVAMLMIGVDWDWTYFDCAAVYCQYGTSVTLTVGLDLQSKGTFHNLMH